MSFLDWLLTLIGRRRVRDVSRMTSDAVGTDASTKKETIDTTEKPLRPNGRRLAIRDPRLLPKPKLNIRSILPVSKKKVMTRIEADRLFATTMRTRDRSIRDLAADIEQLKRYQLPQWLMESDVAQILSLTVKQLRHYSIHRQRETTSHYVTFAIPKRSGGHRLIHAPKRRLKAIQRKLNEQLVSLLPVSPYAHGFCADRSIATNAAPHVGKKVVVKLDLKDCFPSIHFGRVRSLLIGYGFSYPVAQTLAVLMTESPRQPVEIDGQIYHVPVGPRACVQGAPTSPGLCNAIMRRMDYRLAGLAAKYSFEYTRYADDLTFSSQDATAVKRIITLATRIVGEEGFAINSEKTKVARGGTRQRVTGVTVNQTAGMSRKERRRLRAALHQQKQSAQPEIARDRRLVGKLAYVRMLNSDQADALVRAR